MAKKERFKQYSEEIEIPIYGDWLKIVFTNDVIRSAKKLGDETLTPDDTHVEGLFFLNDSGKCIIIYKFDVEMEFIVHEAAHFCFDLFKDRGINPTEDSGEESFCYLLGYIVRNIEKVYQNCHKS
jgi:hypothetical protein